MELREHRRRLQEQLGDHTTSLIDMKPPLPSTPQTGDRPPPPPGTPQVTPIGKGLFKIQLTHFETLKNNG